MNVMLLVTVVLQVLVFQFLADRWTRSLPSLLVGSEELATGPSAEAREWVRSHGYRRRMSGVLLLGIAAVAALGGDVAWGKLLVAVVSVASALLFLASFLHDRTVLTVLGTRRSPPAVRVAALPRATLRDAYAPLWEVLPAVIAGATLALTVWALVNGGTADLLWWPGLQFLVVGGGIALTLRYVRSDPHLSQAVRGTLGDPEMAVSVDARLRNLELKALLGVKTGVVLLLAVEQVERVFATRRAMTPIALEWAEWALIVGLLAVFGSYLIAASRGFAVHGLQRLRD